MLKRQAGNPIFILIALTLGLLFIAPEALADANKVNGEAWTIYGFGNGEVLRDILQGTKFLTADGNFWAIAAFIVLLGGTIAATKVAFGAGSGGGELGLYMLLTFLIGFTAQEEADVVIEDPLLPSNVIVVQDVPAIVAVPVGIISEIGQEITEMVETNFTLPGSLNLSQSGIMSIGQSMLKDMAQLSITDANLRATMAAFSQDCILPSIADGSIDPRAMVTSTNLFDVGGGGFLQTSINPAYLTVVYIDQGSAFKTVPCGPGGAPSGSTTTAANSNPSISEDNAADYIAAYIEATAQGEFNSGLGLSSTPLTSFFGQALQDSVQFLTAGNITASTGSLITQSAAANMLFEGINNAITATGTNAMTNSLAVAQAEQQQLSDWWIAAENFNDIFGYLFSVLHALIILLMPFAILGALIPGGAAKIGPNILKIAFWVALLPPMLSVVNALGMFFTQQGMDGIVGTSLDNFRMQDLPQLSQFAQRQLYVTGWLTTAAPLLTWGLISGGFAITSLISSAIGSSVATAAQSASTGNVSLNNQRFDTHTADQFNTQAAFFSGFSTSSGVGGAGLGGTSIDTDVGGVSDSLLDKVISEARGETIASGRSIQERLGNQLSEAKTLTRTNVQQAANATVDSSVQAFNAATSTSSQEQAMQEFRSQIVTGYQRAREISEEAGQQFLNSVAQALEAKGEIGGQLLSGLLKKGGDLLKGGGGLSASTRQDERNTSGTSASESESTTSGQQTLDNLSTSEITSSLQSLVNSSQQSETSSTTLSETASERLDKAHASRETYESLKAQQQNLSQTLQTLQSIRVSGFDTIAERNAAYRQIMQQQNTLGGIKSKLQEFRSELNSVDPSSKNIEKIDEERANQLETSSPDITQAGGLTGTDVDVKGAGDTSKAANAKDTIADTKGDIESRDKFLQTKIDTIGDKAQELASQFSAQSQNGVFGDNGTNLQAALAGLTAIGLQAAGIATGKAATEKASQIAGNAINNGKLDRDALQEQLGKELRRVDPSARSRFLQAFGSVGDNVDRFLNKFDGNISKAADFIADRTDVGEKIAKRLVSAGASQFIPVAGQAAGIGLAAWGAYDAISGASEVYDVIQGVAREQRKSEFGTAAQDGILQYTRQLQGHDKPFLNNQTLQALASNVDASSPLFNGNGDGRSVLEALVQAQTPDEFRQIALANGVNPKDFGDFLAGTPHQDLQFISLIGDLGELESRQEQIQTAR